LGKGETSRVDQFANLELEMDLGTYEDSFLGRDAFVPDISTVRKVHIYLALYHCFRTSSSIAARNRRASRIPGPKVVKWRRRIELRRLKFGGSIIGTFMSVREGSRNVSSTASQWRRHWTNRVVVEILQAILGY